jgi:hypothetical protein
MRLHTWTRSIRGLNYSNGRTGITCINHVVKKEMYLNFNSLVSIISEFLVGKVHLENSTRMVLKII